MKAVRCCDKKIHVVDVPAPRAKVSSSTCVRRVSVALIYTCLMRVLILGATLGHEVAGTLSDGRAVALEPIAPCGHCDMCVQGDYSLCRLSADMVYGVGRDGGMADKIIVPARCIVPLPNNVSVADACLVEPLAVAAHGIRMLDIKPSQPDSHNRRGCGRPCGGCNFNAACGEGGCRRQTRCAKRCCRAFRRRP